jgi:aspartate kinase
VKIGGSVLTGAAAYRRAARALAERLTDRPGEPIVAVVSAQAGVTDALLREALDLSAPPAQEALDLLWSTGERRSVALLTLALHAAGVRAVAADVHEVGLRVEGDRPRHDRPLRLLALLATADVVVVPGFLAIAPGGRVATLGRGGSDLSAVLLAGGLQASTCELLKDVGGYFSADPAATRHAAHLPALDYDAAIGMARNGCELVQLGALEAARDLGVRLVVRGMADGQATTVGCGQQA